MKGSVTIFLMNIEKEFYAWTDYLVVKQNLIIENNLKIRGKDIVFP